MDRGKHAPFSDPDAELLRRMYRANARAALSALREASAAMIATGADHVAAAQDLSVDRLWAVMLDAALAEDGEAGD